MSIGDFPESLSQAMLVGILLVGRLRVGGGSAATSCTNRKRSYGPGVDGLGEHSVTNALGPSTLGW